MIHCIPRLQGAISSSTGVRFVNQAPPTLGAFFMNNQGARLSRRGKSGDVVFVLSLSVDLSGRYSFSLNCVVLHCLFI